MEPVTHLLTGACLARTGLNRRAAYATGMMAIAAEFPDIDTLWSLRGPVAGFQHHRGVTHTFAGIPVEAAFLLLCTVLVHRYRVRRGHETAAPVRWFELYLFLVLALLSHILLDYTNNYGVRPFLPFNAHWYAASIVFIFDPLLFALLVAGLLLPSLFHLVGREVGSTPQRFPGRGWAQAALIGVLLLWSARWVQHARAVTLAEQQSLRAPATSADLASVEGATTPRPLLSPQRALASPDPLSIFRWYTATDFGQAYQLGTADTRTRQWDPGQVLTKPGQTAALRAAEQTRLGRVYLDWSSMPLLYETAGSPGGATDSPATSDTETVYFTDLRFFGDTPLLRRNPLPPLTGEVVLDRHNRTVAEGLDGKFQR